MIFRWENGDRTIVVEAPNAKAAGESFADIVEKYYPDTTVEDWTVVVKGL